MVRKLMTLISTKGDDVLIQPSGGGRSFKKFRRSVPPALWKWKVVCGWRWCDSDHHLITKLELRAIYTSLLWLMLRKDGLNIRFLYLTDNLVCLHVYNRGRSSSHKIQSLIYRISSLCLASGLHPFISYISTHLNPVDNPSRRVKRK